MEALIDHEFGSFLKRERHPETASALLDCADGTFDAWDMLTSPADFEMGTKLVFKFGKFIVTVDDRDGETTLAEKSDDLFNAGKNIGGASFIGDATSVILFDDATDAIKS